MEYSARHKRRKLRDSINKTISTIKSRDELLAYQTEAINNESSIQPIRVSVNSSESVVTNTLNELEPIENMNMHSDFEQSECSRYATSDQSDFSSASNESHSNTKSLSILENLRNWAINENITQNALDKLLAVLGSHIPGLPKCARTLLKTSEISRASVLGSGEYTHLGLASALQKLIRRDEVLNGYPEITLKFNMDGLPLHKNSSTSLWPILVSILESSLSTAEVVGYYVGDSKPDDLEMYLHKLVEDLEEILKNSLNIGTRSFKVQRSNLIFICDAPARAFIKAVKGHSGYYGCDKCETKGLYDNTFKKITFPETNSSLRTDASFQSRAQVEHHKNPFNTQLTPLEKLKIGMVTQFPHDYMHIVCLGVVRKLLHLWRQGPKRVRIGWTQIKLISSKLNELVPCVPSEFNRKPRDIEISDKWKATECRQFLLYTGPIVLRHVLHSALYDHFLLLSVGINMLLDTSTSVQQLNYASSLIMTFVTHFPVLYGAENVTYNVHGLIHLAEDVRKFGSLDNFSAFLFENHLGNLKRLIRTGHHTSVQLQKRLLERDLLTAGSSINSESTISLSLEHFTGPIPSPFTQVKQFRKLSSRNIILSIGQRDSFFTTGNRQFYHLVNVLQTETMKIILLCEKMTLISPLFSYPCQSSVVGTFICKIIHGGFVKVDLSSVQRKCLCTSVNYSNENELVITTLKHKINC